MVNVENDHFRGTTGPSARFYDSCERVETIHEACRALRTVLDSHVEPYGAVESGHLMEEGMGEFRLKGLGFFLVEEVVSFLPPAGDGSRDTAYELFNAAFSSRGPESAAEIFRGDDICCGLGPERGNFDTLLFEDDLSFVVGYDRIPDFPFYSVVWVDSWFRVGPLISEFSSGYLRYLLDFHCSYLTPILLLSPCLRSENRRSSSVPSCPLIKEICTESYKLVV